MTITRNLHMGNISPVSLSSMPNREELNTDTQSGNAENSNRSPDSLQRFPSPIIDKDSFIRIDDDWPRQQPPDLKKSTNSLFARQREWIRGHYLITSIAVMILLFLLLAIALAIVLPLTLSNSKYNGATISNSSFTIPIEAITSSIVSSSSSTTATTREPFKPGYWIDINVQWFEFNDSIGVQSLRPDIRNPGDYLAIANDRIILLTSCSKHMIALRRWNSSVIARCNNNSVTVIDYRLSLRSYSRCDAFDVLESCRENATLCCDSSFAFCCRNDSMNSTMSICSLRGSSLINYGSIFLDAQFIYRNVNSYSLEFSTLSHDYRNLCVLHQQRIGFEMAQMSHSTYPSRSCDIETTSLSHLQSAAIVTLGNLQNTWKALLLDSDVIYLSNINGTMHTIHGVEGENAKLLMQHDSADSVLLIDISMVSGVFSAIRVWKNCLEILTPRKVSISIPGKFVDAFLDNGELVLWNMVDRGIFVARVRFAWT